MMDPATIAKAIFTPILGGALGGAAMLAAMRLMTRSGLHRGSMVVALGGLLTKSRDTAPRAGFVAHTISAVVFAALYMICIHRIGVTSVLRSVEIGVGLGLVQGLIVSLMLVWIVAEGHPFEEYNEAGLAVGLSHLLGHVVYGAVVGLVVGLVGF